VLEYALSLARDLAHSWPSWPPSILSVCNSSIIPSGFSNRYSKVPYAFLTVITISSLGMLSDAIICRAKWNNSDILHERDVMLGND